MRILAVVGLVAVALTLGQEAAARPPSQGAARAEEVRTATPEGWDVFESAEGRFSILLPTHRRTAEAEDNGIVVHIVQARALDDCEYAVLWSDPGGVGRADTLAALLSAIAEGRGVSGEHGDVVAGQDRRSGLNGRKLQGASERAEMDLRAYADGGRLYQIYAMCPREKVVDRQGQEHASFDFAEPERRAFFASFVVEKADSAAR
jgi:hypothetical protein